MPSLPLMYEGPLEFATLRNPSTPRPVVNPAPSTTPVAPMDASVRVSAALRTVSNGPVGDVSRLRISFSASVPFPFEVSVLRPYTLSGSDGLLSGPVVLLPPLETRVGELPEAV